MADTSPFLGKTSFGGSVGYSSPTVFYFQVAAIPINAVPTFKITNTGNSVVYFGYGRGGKASVTPSSSTESFNSFAVGENTGVVENAPPGTDTIALICSGSNSSSVEISIGYGL